MIISEFGAAASNPIGEIIALSGPSSTGKSTYSSELVSRGWIHLEGDRILTTIEIGLAEKHFLDDLNILKSYLKDPNPERILEVIQKGNPDTTTDMPKFERARAKLKAFFDARWAPGNEDRNWQEVFMHMLEVAVKCAEQGKSVILDTVGMLNEEPPSSSPHLTRTEGRRDAWTYKNFTIQQKLKFVSIDRLILNIIQRNRDPLNYRDPVYVLNQYVDRFKMAASDQPVIGTVSIDTIEKSIERAVKMKFFGMVESGDNIDQDIQKKMDEMARRIEGLAKSENEADRKLAQEQSSHLKNITGHVESTKKLIFEKMGIPGHLPRGTMIPITYKSTQGSQPEIIP